MKKIIISVLGLLCCYTATAQREYSLQQLVDSALHNNYAVQKAKFSIEAAQHQRKEAYTKYFPNVSAVAMGFQATKGMAEMSLNPSEMLSPEMGTAISQMLPAEALAALASPVSISMMKNGVIGSIMAVQPVYAGGKIVNGNKLAKIGEEVSYLQLQLSENDIQKNVEQYYWQLVSLHEKMNTLDAVSTLLNDLHKTAEVAVRAGVTLRNDLLQVELRQNDIASNKLKLKNGISIIKLLMSQYCGLQDTTFTVKTEKVSLSDPLLVDKSSALASLPEYQLLEKQVEAADLQIKMEKGKAMPTVAVGAGYNYHNLLDNNQHFGMVFATVNIPISDWWGNGYAVKRKKIEQQQAISQLKDNSEMLQIRMQKSWNDVMEAQQQILLAKQGLEQATENLRLNRTFYKAGTAKMSDLLEAQLLYQQCCDKQTDAEANYHQKLLDYRLATGTR